MSSPSTPPAAGVPSGNGKYYAIAVVLLLLIGGVIFWQKSKSDPTPPPPPPPSATASYAPPPRKVEDDIPLPPPVEDAGPETGPKVVQSGPQTYGCEVKKCAGSPAGDMESMLAFRAKAAHKCYDQALATDSTLSGGVTIALRIGTNGAPCSAGVASNSTGNAAVAQCIANAMRNGAYPAPKGGCVDVNVPISLRNK